MPITLFGYTYLTCTTYLAGGKAQIHWPLPLERVQQPDESGEGTAVERTDANRIERGWRERKADRMSKRTL